MSDIVEFPIHFNTADHFIRASDFVAFTKDLEKISQEFGKSIFGKNSLVQIYVLPPKEGTFLGKWGIGLVLVGVWNGLDTDITKSFVKGLTGNEPAYYSEMAGNKTKNRALLLKDVTKSFLEKTETEIAAPRENFASAYEARSDFYKKCLENIDIKAIGFTCGEEFPISRKDFIKRIATLPDNTSDLIPEYEIHRLLISSSVNTFNSNAQWRLQDTQTKTFLYAYLKDVKFQKDFFSGEFPLKSSEKDDVITAMVEYKKQFRDGEVKIIERNIIKVYQFNNVVIEEIPNGEVISAVDKVKAGASHHQMNLLDSVQHPSR